MRVELVTRHPFAPSGRYELDRRGRRLELCATCGRKRIGLTHGRREEPARRAGRDIEGPAGVRDTHERVSPAPPPPRELLLVALALDALLELPAGSLEWRLELRAHALREAIALPRSEAFARPAEEAAPGTATNPAEPLRDAELLEVLEAPPAARIEDAPPALRSRARALTRGITDKRYRELAVRAVIAGWNLRRTGAGHWLIEHGRESITFSSTPSDRRAWLNTRARARRAGLDVEGL